jgi:hypothetical protein
MDDRRTLRIVAASLGGIFFACFALSAIAMQ